VEEKPRLSYKLIKEKLELQEYLEYTTGKRKKALVEMRGVPTIWRSTWDDGDRLRWRIESVCKGGVEDEIHLVLECPAYEDNRGKC